MLKWLVLSTGLVQIIISQDPLLSTDQPNNVTDNLNNKDIVSSTIKSSPTEEINNESSSDKLSDKPSSSNKNPEPTNKGPSSNDIQEEPRISPEKEPSNESRINPTKDEDQFSSLPDTTKSDVREEIKSTVPNQEETHILPNKQPSINSIIDQTKDKEQLENLKLSDSEDREEIKSTKDEDKDQPENGKLSDRKPSTKHKEPSIESRIDQTKDKEQLENLELSDSEDREEIKSTKDEDKDQPENDKLSDRKPSTKPDNQEQTRISPDEITSIESESIVNPTSSNKKITTSSDSVTRQIKPDESTKLSIDQQNEINSQVVDFKSPPNNRKLSPDETAPPIVEDRNLIKTNSTEQSLEDNEEELTRMLPIDDSKLTPTNHEKTTSTEKNSEVKSQDNLRELESLLEEPDTKPIAKDTSIKSEESPRVEINQPTTIKSNTDKSNLINNNESGSLLSDDTRENETNFKQEGNLVDKSPSLNEDTKTIIRTTPSRTESDTREQLQVLDDTTQSPSSRDINQVTSSPDDSLKNPNGSLEDSSQLADGSREILSQVSDNDKQNPSKMSDDKQNPSKISDDKQNPSKISDNDKQNPSKISDDKPQDISSEHEINSLLGIENLPLKVKDTDELLEPSVRKVRESDALLNPPGALQPSNSLKPPDALNPTDSEVKSTSLLTPPNALQPNHSNRDDLSEESSLKPPEALHPTKPDSDSLVKSTSSLTAPGALNTGNNDKDGEKSLGPLNNDNEFTLLKPPNTGKDDENGTLNNANDVESTSSLKAPGALNTGKDDKGDESSLIKLPVTLSNANDNKDAGSISLTKPPSALSNDEESPGLSNTAKDTSLKPPNIGNDDKEDESLLKPLLESTSLKPLGALNNDKEPPGSSNTAKDTSLKPPNTGNDDKEDESLLKPLLESTSLKPLGTLNNANDDNDAGSISLTKPPRALSNDEESPGSSNTVNDPESTFPPRALNNDKDDESNSLMKPSGVLTNDKETTPLTKPSGALTNDKGDESLFKLPEDKDIESTNSLKLPGPLNTGNDVESTTPGTTNKDVGSPPGALNNDKDLETSLGPLNTGNDIESTTSPGTLNNEKDVENPPGPFNSSLNPPDALHTTSNLIVNPELIKPTNVDSNTKSTSSNQPTNLVNDDTKATSTNLVNDDTKATSTNLVNDDTKATSTNQVLKPTSINQGLKPTDPVIKDSKPTSINQVLKPTDLANDDSNTKSILNPPGALQPTDTIKQTSNNLVNEPTSLLNPPGALQPTDSNKEISNEFIVEPTTRTRTPTVATSRTSVEHREVFTSIVIPEEKEPVVNEEKPSTIINNNQPVSRTIVEPTNNPIVDPEPVNIMTIDLNKDQPPPSTTTSIKPQNTEHIEPPISRDPPPTTSSKLPFIFTQPAFIPIETATATSEPVQPTEVQSLADNMPSIIRGSQPISELTKGEIMFIIKYQDKSFFDLLINPNDPVEVSNALPQYLAYHLVPGQAKRFQVLSMEPYNPNKITDNVLKISILITQPPNTDLSAKDLKSKLDELIQHHFDDLPSNSLLTKIDRQVYLSSDPCGNAITYDPLPDTPKVSPDQIVNSGLDTLKHHPNKDNKSLDPFDQLGSEVPNPLNPFSSTIKKKFTGWSTKPTTTSNSHQMDMESKLYQHQLQVKIVGLTLALSASLIYGLLTLSRIKYPQQFGI